MILLSSGLGLLMGKFRQYLTELSWIYINGFSPNLVCALILLSSGLGLPVGKFRQCLTELCARHTIKAGDYSLTLLFCSLQITSMGSELSLCLTIKVNLSPFVQLHCHHSCCIYLFFHWQLTIYTITHSYPFLCILWLQKVVIKGKEYMLWYIQSTLIISKSKGLYETLRDCRTSTYQICGTEENN